MSLTSEQPAYILPQTKKRAVTPKIISLIILNSIFYLGIMLNLALLNFEKSTDSLIRTVSLLFVILILALGLYLTFHQANKRYIFYRDRIIFETKEIHYQKIINTKPKQDFFDKLLKTYSINLGSNFIIRHIPSSIDLQAYLNQLISYSQQQY